jgi:hypothetical protein
MESIRSAKNWVKNHREMREKINATMGLIPVITLSITFLYSIIYLTYFINKETPILDLMSLSTYLIMLPINVLMSLTLGSINQDNDLYLKMIEWSCRDNCGQILFSKAAEIHLNEEKLAFIDYLNSLIDNPQQHNACKFFTIDRKFLLSFMEILISFCVMFIQMYQTQ